MRNQFGDESRSEPSRMAMEGDAPREFGAVPRAWNRNTWAFGLFIGAVIVLLVSFFARPATTAEVEQLRQDLNTVSTALSSHVRWHAEDEQANRGRLDVVDAALKAQAVYHNELDDIQKDLGKIHIQVDEHQRIASDLKFIPNHFSDLDAKVNGINRRALGVK